MAGFLPTVRPEKDKLKVSLEKVKGLLENLEVGG
jgi:hypothetical protein